MKRMVTDGDVRRIVEIVEHRGRWLRVRFAFSGRRWAIAVVHEEDGTQPEVSGALDS